MYGKQSFENKDAIIFGIHVVTSVARLIEYGRSVCATGYRDSLHVVSLPCKNVDECCNLGSSLFDIPCQIMCNYLNVTLTPSNPILHTARLKCIFEHYSEGYVYKDVPLFYEDWDDATSELLLKMED